MQTYLKLFIILALIAVSFSKFNIFKSNGVNHYAVLVAGSNGFWNYRHQSDIFHSYQILIANGLPKENIIVLAYDDIANDSENPIKGKVFNKPDPTGQGFDVYQGVTIDYKGADVNPDVFLAVLSGDASKVKGKGTGRVLQSTENDNVFIYFSDHGATGLIAFPDSELYADQLISTLKKMHSNNKYKELVFYLEACESGSMFNKILPNNMNIYATTAANPDQSSWATYCSPDDKIGNVNIGSCLGDEYSVNWIEDSERDSGLTESLQSQYEHVKERTKNSEVHQYGQLDFVENDIGQYQGNHGQGLYDKVRNIFNKLVKKAIRIVNKDKNRRYLNKAKKSAVDSRDAKLKYFYDKLSRTNSKKSEEEYKNELYHIQKVDSSFNTFNEVFNISNNDVVDFINFECLRSSILNYKSICGWGEYELKYVKNIALACERNYSVEDITETFKKICMV